MPVNVTLLNALINKHGEEKGKEIYAAMENDNKPSFQKALHTAISQGHTIEHLKDWKPQKPSGVRIDYVRRK